MLSALLTGEQLLTTELVWHWRTESVAIGHFLTQVVTNKDLIIKKNTSECGEAK